MIVFVHYTLQNFANVYLVANEETHEALIIDPAAFTLGLLNFIEKRSCSVKAILITHNHPHHIAGLKTLLKIYDAAVYSSNAALGNISCRILEDGELFTACGMQIKALSVPGHSADSMVYVFDKLFFTGDSLYAGRVGKTMSQYGNKLIKENIAKKILTQSGDGIILPAHGPPSTIAAEKLFNPAFSNEH